MMRASVLASVLLLGLQAQAGWEGERTKALQLRLDNRTADAVKVLEAAATRYPQQAGVHYELADALLEQVHADSLGTSPPADRPARLERVATHFRRAMALDPQYRQVAAARLVSVYEEDDFKRPQEVERLSRDLMAMDPGSSVWPIKLAHGLAEQQRCSEAARVLMAARRTVDPDRRLLLGMAMPELVLKCDDMPLADARPLLEAAEAIAAEILKTTPDDRDVVMLQTAAVTALASKLPDGPEKTALEKRGSEAMDRFMALNPGRQAALRGEAPERVFDGFSYLNEFHTAGKTAEAQRLYASMKTRHADSAEFWSSAASYHQLRREREDAIAAAQRYVALAPPEALPHLMLGNMHLMWAMDEAEQPARRVEDLKAAQSAIDTAIAAGPNNTDALMSKAELLKAQAALEKDPARRQALLAEVKTWLARAAAAYKAQQKP